MQRANNALGQPFAAISCATAAVGRASTKPCHVFLLIKHVFCFFLQVHTFYEAVATMLSDKGQPGLDRTKLLAKLMVSQESRKESQPEPRASEGAIKNE